MIQRFLLALIVVTLSAASSAADYSISVLEEAAPADELAPEIAKQLSPTGFKVMRSETSTLCHIWLCKQWNVADGFKPTAELQYPFQQGQLVGVIQYKRRGEDFREQDVNRGVYTLRYALQPTDGNHEGTSATRDFLLVVKAEDDKSPEPMDVEKLFAASKEAAESSHPGLLAMKSPSPEAKTEKPLIREQAEDEWWIISITGAAAVGDKASPLTMDVVIMGHADE